MVVGCPFEFARSVLRANTRQYRVSESLFLTTCTESNCAWVEVSEGSWFREFEVSRYEAAELLREYRSKGRSVSYEGLTEVSNRWMFSSSVVYLRPQEIREEVVI